MLVTAGTVGAIGLSKALTAQADSTTASEYTAVYRIYNTDTQEHLYTTHLSEVDTFLKEDSD